MSTQSKLQKVIKNLVLFLIPWYLYQSLIRFLGYTPHDDLANTWGQFRWLANYLIRPVNFLSDKIIATIFLLCEIEINFSSILGDPDES